MQALQHSCSMYELHAPILYRQSSTTNSALFSLSSSIIYMYLYRALLYLYYISSIISLTIAETCESTKSFHIKAFTICQSLQSASKDLTFNSTSCQEMIPYQSILPWISYLVQNIAYLYVLQQELRHSHLSKRLVCCLSGQSSDHSSRALRGGEQGSGQCSNNLRHYSKYMDDPKGTCVYVGILSGISWG